MHIAAELGLPVVDARIDGLISSYLGTTARNIANLFSFANRYRCLLLLDEFDAIAKLRDDPQEVGEIKRVVNSLLQSLDGRADIGITIAITNHHRLLDTAVWRRFDSQLQLALPDEAARQGMISRALKPLPGSQPLVQLMAYVTDGCSGADINRFARAMKRRIALRNSEPTAPMQFKALCDILAREPPARTAPRVSRLLDNLEAFSIDALRDPLFPVKQKPLATLIGVNQGTVSRWLTRAAAAAGEPHAQ
jgi:SpoVK/Ycf46/Vps4 family AAA+-type ATPase